MRKYREVFNDNPFVYNRSEGYLRGIDKSGPFTVYVYDDSVGKKYKWKYVFIWRALTPSGKPSNAKGAFSTLKTNSFEDYKKYIPKKPLKPGYSWSETLLYGEYPTYNNQERRNKVIKGDYHEYTL